MILGDKKLPIYIEELVDNIVLSLTTNRYIPKKKYYTTAEYDTKITHSCSYMLLELGFYHTYSTELYWYDLDKRSKLLADFSGDQPRMSRVFDCGDITHMPHFPGYHELKEVLQRT